MNLLKYSISVLMGAISYGLLSTFVKLAYQEGFTVSEVINAQYFTGWSMILVLILLFSRKKVPAKKWSILILVGLNTSLTGIFYGLSLQHITASLGVVLLFQFTWIGILIEAIVDRRIPSKEKLLAIFVLVIGTFLAGGIFEHGFGKVSTMGILFGLLSAVTFSIFIFVSGRVATDVPALNRSFFLSTGALITTLILLSPQFLYNGSIQAGLWKYGLFLGLFGIVVPVVFFAIGMPKVGPGLGSILGAAELPTAILMSVFVLKESVSLFQWAGILLILIGITIPQLNLFRKKSLQAVTK